MLNKKTEKKNEARFSLQFDETNPAHFNAIVILNDKGRNKSNYIAELINQREREEDYAENLLANKGLLKSLIKECLVEVLNENKNLLSFLQNGNDELNKFENNDIIVLEDKNNDKLNRYNKEIINSLSCFGIKK